MYVGATSPPYAPPAPTSDSDAEKETSYHSSSIAEDTIHARCHTIRNSAHRIQLHHTTHRSLTQATLFRPDNDVLPHSPRYRTEAARRMFTDRRQLDVTHVLGVLHRLLPTFPHLDAGPR